MNSRFRNVSANSLLQVLCICISFLAMNSGAALRTWTGATGDELASTPGNWGGTAPQTGDDIVLNSTSHSNMTWNMTNLVIGSWTQSDYQGTVTVATVYNPSGFTNLNITGDCVISNGVWTHVMNTGNNSAPPVYRLCANIGGNLVVGPDAAILAEAVGMYQGYAKAGHGGRAYGISSSVSYRCPGGEIYGSVIGPTNVGHGGFSRGGGAVLMTVSGRTTVDGAVSANAGDSTYYSGAGGSVWIVSGKFDGAGTVSANAGNITGHSSGGGGRVAIVLTDPGEDFSGFSGTVSAYGGRIGAGPMRAGPERFICRTGMTPPAKASLWWTMTDL